MALLPHRTRRGGNAIEFALCLPLWVLIVAAIMDFGWIFYGQTTLDAAANIGCREGALMDPGEGDIDLLDIQEATTLRMLTVLTSFGFDECTSCEVEATTVGDPPARSLICAATREVAPITGVFTDARTLTSTQVARLEWQRAGAPE